MKRRRGSASARGSGARGNGFRREDGQDELLLGLGKARLAFQASIAEETAFQADSLDPLVRATARKILGIGNEEFQPAEEARIATMKKVVDGEPYAMFALARELISDADIDPQMREYAGTLVAMHSMAVLKAHAADPASSREKELMEALETIGQPIIRLLSEDLALIAKRSPYESVRTTAKAMLDSSGSS